MSRPNTTRRSVRARTEEPASSAGLGVYAPLLAPQANPEASALGGLADALGVFTKLGTAFAAQKRDADFAQGKADKALGKEDVLRMAKSESYADGVYETNVLKHYGDAEAKVSQRVVDELDHSLPVHQQVAIVDGWMKEELGGLVSDPKARLLIAKQYQPFIERFGGEVVAGQNKARAEEVVQVTEDAAAAEIDRTGALDWGSHWKRLTAVLGNGGDATKELVSLIGRRMVENARKGGDWQKLRGLIPSEIATESGQTLPSPLKSQANRDLLAKYEAAAESEYRQYMDPATAAAQAQLRIKLDANLRDLIPITAADVGAIGPSGRALLGPEAQAGYLDEYARKRAAADAKDEEMKHLGAAMQANGGLWRSAIGADGGFESMEQAQAFANGQFENLVDGILGKGNHSPVAIIQQKDSALRAVLVVSAEQRMAYEPLREFMRSVTSAAPGGVLARLDAYREMKSAGDGVMGLYLDDETHALYETALDYADYGGGDARNVEDYLRRSGDSGVSAYVSTELPKLKMRTQSAEMDVINEFRNKQTSDMANAGYVAGRLENFARVGLSKGQSPAAALAFARTRFGETHVALPVGGKVYALPRSEIGDANEAAKALAWWAEVTPQLAAKHKVAGAENATIVPSVGILSRRMEFELRDADGIPIPGTKAIPLDTLLRVYRKTVNTRAEANAASVEAQKNRAEEAARLKRQLDNLPRPGHE